MRTIPELRLAVLLALAGCSRSEADVARLPGATTATGPIDVTVAAVRRTPISLPVVASGTTEPIRAADLGPQLTAQISAVLVTEGDVVEEGQPLVRMDMRDASLRA